MTAVDLYDVLFLEPTETGVVEFAIREGYGNARQRRVEPCEQRTMSDHEALPAGQDNLVWKAVRLFQERAGVPRGITIQLIKRIPIAAGLGGASSDAAAALMGANLVWRTGWSEDRLRELAAELGSDIPFFIGSRSGRSSWSLCRGRGERITRLACPAGQHFVLVRPPVGVSTGRVYQRCKPAISPRSPSHLVDWLQGAAISDLRAGLWNRLQPAAEQLCPWISKLRQFFERFDGVGHLMSGSGSTYFAVCQNARQARRLLGQVRASGLGRAHHVRSVPLSLPRAMASA